MHFREHIILALLFTVAFGLKDLFAQKQIDDQYNCWYMYFGNHRLSEKWSLHTEYQWLRHDWIKTWQQQVFRVGLDYHTKGNRVMITWATHG